MYFGVRGFRFYVGCNWTMHGIDAWIDDACFEKRHVPSAAISIAGVPSAAISIAGVPSAAISIAGVPSAARSIAGVSSDSDRCMLSFLAQRSQSLP